MGSLPREGCALAYPVRSFFFQFLQRFKCNCFDTGTSNIIVHASLGHRCQYLLTEKRESVPSSRVLRFSSFCLTIVVLRVTILMCGSRTREKIT